MQPPDTGSAADAAASAAVGSDPTPDDGSDLRLGVAAAARRLGVAPATLRTWDRRYGMGPSEHAAGRHRRYSAEDIARLELMQHAVMRGVTPADAARYALDAALPPPRPLAPAAGGPAPRPAADRTGGQDPADSPVRAGGRVLRMPGAGAGARGLGRAALALDAREIRALLEESIAAVGLRRTWDQVARPVLVAVAERWEYTGAGIEIEHLLSECVVAVFGAHAFALPVVADSRPVLLAGMPGEQHTLPIVVLCAELAERGVPCRWLGSNLPVASLVAAIRRTAPAAVVLWSQLTDTADPDVLRSLPRTQPRYRVFAAGPGWAPGELPPRTVLLGSLGEASAEISAAVQV